MLNLHHQQTPHIFAAAKQLDLILGYLKRITFVESSSRLRMLEVIRPCFAALRWLQLQRFAEAPQIADSIDELERAAEELANLARGNDKRPTYESCPVCHTPLTIYEPQPGMEVPKERWCSPCLQVAMPALAKVESLEEGFGTVAI